MGWVQGGLEASQTPYSRPQPPHFTHVGHLGVGDPWQGLTLALEANQRFRVDGTVLHHKNKWVFGGWGTRARWKGAGQREPLGHLDLRASLDPHLPLAMASACVVQPFRGLASAVLGKGAPGT